MATRLQLRRGTDAESNNFTGALAEITFDTTNKFLCIHDGNTKGGIKVLSANMLSLNPSSSTTSTSIPTIGWLNDSTKSTNLVHRNGNEEISGKKTFTSTITSNVINFAAPNNVLNVNLANTSQYADIVSAFDTTNNVRCAGIRINNDNTSHSITIGANDYGDNNPLGIVVSCDTDNKITTKAITPDDYKDNSTNIATTKWVRQVLDTLYSVGSIYIGIQSTCPLETLGIGTWVLVEGNRTLWSSNGSNANSKLDAGLPNITGGVTNDGTGCDEGACPGKVTSSGAFDVYKSSGNGASGSSGYGAWSFNFDASKSNKIYGNSTTVQPPAYVVNIWRRIA